MIKEAAYYTKEQDGIRCSLCPHNCFIKPGKRGLCKVRRNNSQMLIAESWGKISAMHLDPMEKKPLYHFHPGKKILSVGSFGCNMFCKCCQNWQISQTTIPDAGRITLPAGIVEEAMSVSDNTGIAFTYNEPSVGFEYVLETARLSKLKGLKNVMVSNGYIATDPLNDLVDVVDAFNIDLKGFDPHFYKTFTGAKMHPVLETLENIQKAGRHLEITCLVVPGENDDPALFEKMTSWIASVTGRNTVLHVSAYRPGFKLHTAETPASTLEKLLQIASENLFHVYAGNVRVRDFQNTRCSKCFHEVIKRMGYFTEITGLTSDGACIRCGNKEIIV